MSENSFKIRASAGKNLGLGVEKRSMEIFSSYRARGRFPWKE